MKYRPLGKTGLKISELSYGCGGFWGLPYMEEAKAIALVHEALDRGVNFFDTGASYCRGEAEVRLGKALKGRNLDKVIVGTKAGTILKKRGLGKDFSATSINAQVEESLRKLGLESLPILQLHAPRLQDLNDDLYEILTRLKESGKVQNVGASCDHDILKKFLTDFTPDVIMLTYNLIEQEGLENINLAHELGAGILIKSPMAHNLYSNRIFKITKLADLWYFLRVLKNYRRQLIQGQKFKFIRTLPNMTEHEVALRFALHEKVSSVVIGSCRLENIERNCQALEKNIPQEIITKIEQTYKSFA